MFCSSPDRDSWYNISGKQVISSEYSIKINNSINTFINDCKIIVLEDLGVAFHRFTEQHFNSKMRECIVGNYDVKPEAITSKFGEIICLQNLGGFEINSNSCYLTREGARDKIVSFVPNSGILILTEGYSSHWMGSRNCYNNQGKNPMSLSWGELCPIANVTSKYVSDEICNKIINDNEDVNEKLLRVQVMDVVIFNIKFNNGNAWMIGCVHFSSSKITFDVAEMVFDILLDDDYCCTHIVGDTNVTSGKCDGSTVEDFSKSSITNLQCSTITTPKFEISKKRIPENVLLNNQFLNKGSYEPMSEMDGMIIIKNELIPKFVIEDN